VSAYARRRADHQARRLAAQRRPHDYVTPDADVADACSVHPDLIEATDYRDRAAGNRRFRLAPRST
jgi:hypothetical protein